MKKILEYKLVISTTAERFENTINLMIENGWQPYGSGYSCAENNMYLVQPMVIYQENRTRPLPK